MSVIKISARQTRLLLIVTVWVLVAALPVALVGLSFEHSARQWIESVAHDPKNLLLTSFLLLAADIALPIPSSFVCTLCGQSVSWLTATIVCGGGMVAGSAVGFQIGRIWGRPVAARFSSEEDLRLVDNLIARRGAWWLVVLRPVPVVAEAAVLLSGAHHMHWTPFLLATGTSSFVIAGIFSLLGRLSTSENWTIAAWCASIAIPLVFVLAVRKLLRLESHESQPRNY